jgi:hypothetical protein
MTTETKPTIKAGELRIGNFIYQKFDYNDEGKLDSTKEFYKVPNASFSRYENEIIYSPIPLTPELLEKCGFEKDAEYKLEPVASCFTLDFTSSIKGANTHDFTALVVNQDTKENKKGSVSVSYTVNGLWASNDIQYLHQLQNLYFALTGEELPINL